MTNITFLKMPEVMKMTGLSKSTIYRFMEMDQFPKKVNLGERAVAWRSDEIEMWIKQRIVRRPTPQYQTETAIPCSE